MKRAVRPSLKRRVCVQCDAYFESCWRVPAAAGEGLRSTHGFSRQGRPVQLYRACTPWQYICVDRSAAFCGDLLRDLSAHLVHNGGSFTGYYNALTEKFGISFFGMTEKHFLTKLERAWFAFHAGRLAPLTPATNWAGLWGIRDSSEGWSREVLPPVEWPFRWE